jgi:hypothetical protein
MQGITIGDSTGEMVYLFSNTLRNFRHREPLAYANTDEQMINYSKQCRAGISII